MTTLRGKKKEYLLEYKKIKDQVKKAEKKLEALKALIDAEVDYGVYTVGGLMISITEKSRDIPDQTAIKKFLGEKFEKFKKKSTYLDIRFNKVG